jgi:hypothetical protein
MHINTYAQATLATGTPLRIDMTAVNHTYIHTYIHTYTHTYTHTYIHTYIHTYAHAYIHTGNAGDWDPSWDRHDSSSYTSSSKDGVPLLGNNMAQWSSTNAKNKQNVDDTKTPGKNSVDDMKIPAKIDGGDVAGGEKPNAGWWGSFYGTRKSLPCDGHEKNGENGGKEGKHSVDAEQNGAKEGKTTWGDSPRGGICMSEGRWREHGEFGAKGEEGKDASPRDETGSKSEVKGGKSEVPWGEKGCKPELPWGGANNALNSPGRFRRGASFGGAGGVHSNQNNQAPGVDATKSTLGGDNVNKGTLGGDYVTGTNINNCSGSEVNNENTDNNNESAWIVTLFLAPMYGW